MVTLSVLETGCPVSCIGLAEGSQEESKGKVVEEQYRYLSCFCEIHRYSRHYSQCTETLFNHHPQVLRNYTLSTTFHTAPPTPTLSSIMVSCARYVAMSVGNSCSPIRTCWVHL